MKNKLVTYLFGTLLFSTSLSCTSVLDTKPFDIINDAVVWEDASLIEAYLTNCYAKMYYLDHDAVGGMSDYTNGAAGSGLTNTAVLTDESRPQWLDWDLTPYRFKKGQLNIGGGCLEYWDYAAIRSLNIFIEKVPTSPLDEKLKSTRLAEARFIRAFTYFTLVKRYGGIPVITRAQQLDDPYEELFPKRDKEEEVYKFILSELEEVAKVLPEPGDISANDLGRPSKYVALALKSRAALYAASIAQYGKVQLDGVVGIPSAKASEYYQVAYDAAKAIIGSNKFGLYDADADKTKNFRDLFLVKNNKEVIFARRHDDINALIGGNGTGYDFWQCPRPHAWGRGNENAPYLEMAEAFEYIDGRPGKLDRAKVQQGLWTTEELWKDKDPRFYATLYTQGTSWKGAPLDFHKGIICEDGTIQTKDSYKGVLANGDQENATTCFGILKYLNEAKDNMQGGNSGWATSSQDIIVFRLGEIYLNLAEAAFELGKTGEAKDAVNEIRKRAGIPQLESVDRDKIRQERRVELAFENHRFWDARRWRTAEKLFTGSFSGINYILDYVSYTKGELKYKIVILDDIDGTVNPPLFKPENYYLPITIGRTGNNPNLVENPGYK